MVSGNSPYKLFVLTSKISGEVKFSISVEMVPENSLKKRFVTWMFVRFQSVGGIGTENVFCERSNS